MAKSSHRGTRDHNTIANETSLRTRPSVRVTLLTPLPGFPSSSPVDDLREWHPLGDDRPINHQSGRPANRPRLTDHFGSRLRNRQTRAILAFQQSPRDPVSVCARRHTRKEVLHALRKTGRGGGRKRPPRYNWRSKVKC